MYPTDVQTTRLRHKKMTKQGCMTPPKVHNFSITKSKDTETIETWTKNPNV
jgi:hypothetical protein